MRWLLVSLAACSTVHSGGVSVQADHHRRARLPDEHCGHLTGLRRETCFRIGPPNAPERADLATATWWLYLSRRWAPVPGSVKDVGPQSLCAQYVTFDQERVFESDEQCHEIRSYEKRN